MRRAGWNMALSAKRTAWKLCFAAIKVQTKAKATDLQLERVVVLMDGLFAIDREAREQKLSLDDRHALRQERAHDILAELHALLLEMRQAGSILPKSIAGKAISYTLTRWEKLTLCH